MRGGTMFIAALGSAALLVALGFVDGVADVVAATVTLAASGGNALFAHGGSALVTEPLVLGHGGAAVYEAARPQLPLAGATILLTYVFMRRARQSRGWRELAFHLGSGFAAGAIASWTAMSYSGIDATLLLLAVVGFALLSSIPWLVPTDAPRALVLRALALRARGPRRLCLLRAHVAHRRIADADIPADERRRVERALDRVLRRAERARGYARLEPALAEPVLHLVRVARVVTRRGRAAAWASGDADLDRAIAAFVRAA